MPLMVGEERYGLLTLLFHQPLAIGDEDLELVESVVAQAAALRNTRLHEATERQARRLAALLDVNRRLALGPRLDLLRAHHRGGGPPARGRGRAAAAARRRRAGTPGDSRLPRMGRRRRAARAGG
ncbi:MAG: hypothetical protein M3O34_17770 [Chloroflexota bacterium]|nr:hypothetical protein [Chloroflexota bacterium]